MSEEKVREEKKPSAKIISIVCTVLTVILAALTCYVVVSIIIAKTQDKPVNLFGSSFAVVLTDSMEPEIMTGDLIVFRLCDIGEVNEKDSIVFLAGDGFDKDVRGKSIVHQAISLTEYGIQTKGVNNDLPDRDLVTEDNFLGICTFNSAFLGALFTFVSKYGIFILIAAIALPFIIRQVVKIVKLAKNGDNDNAKPNDEEDSKEFWTTVEGEKPDDTNDKSE